VWSVLWGWWFVRDVGGGSWVGGLIGVRVFFSFCCC